MSATETGSLARLCKALADPLRLEILRLLRTESFGVLELSRIVDVRQSALSHHLKVLATAGLVSTRREGNSIFYRRALLRQDDPLFAFRHQALDSIDRLPLREALRQRLHAVQRERSRQSLEFFSRNADKFRVKQALVTHHGQYEDNLRELLDGLPLSRDCRVLEVGPGEGRLLSQLAERYASVIGLDNSLEMLEKARATVKARGLDNVSFIHGDTETAVTGNQQCELVICNMVLHHIPSPAAALRDCGRLLPPGGRLLLIDLCSHDQDWVREACGDLWLGFDNEDLEDWSAQAGLASDQSMYLGLRNGFQIQMRLFTKPQKQGIRR